MRFRKESISSKSEVLPISMQDLSIEAQEMITGGDGTCSRCSVDDLSVVHDEDEDIVDIPVTIKHEI